MTIDNETILLFLNKSVTAQNKALNESFLSNQKCKKFISDIAPMFDEIETVIEKFMPEALRFVKEIDKGTVYGELPTIVLEKFKEIGMKFTQKLNGN